MDTFFTFTIITTVVLVLTQGSYSSGFEKISETTFSLEKSNPSKTSNLDYNEHHSTPPLQIPYLQHYMVALNQQSVLTALANLPVTTKKNMIKVLEELISIFGSENPASIIISHILRLLKNLPQHSSHRKEVGEDEKEEDELQVRGLAGFDFGPPAQEDEIVEKTADEKLPPLKTSPSKKNKVQRVMRDSTSKKSSDMQIRTMSV